MADQQKTEDEPQHEQTCIHGDPSERLDKQCHCANLVDYSNIPIPAGYPNQADPHRSGDGWSSIAPPGHVNGRPLPGTPTTEIRAVRAPGSQTWHRVVEPKPGPGQAAFKLGDAVAFDRPSFCGWISAPEWLTVKRIERDSRRGPGRGTGTLRPLCHPFGTTCLREP